LCCEAAPSIDAPAVVPIIETKYEPLVRRKTITVQIESVKNEVREHVTSLH